MAQPAATKASGFIPALKNHASQVLGIPASGNAGKTLETDLEYRMISCIDTSGQSFAVLLNVMYLFPLTWLFVQFFIRSYVSRKEPGKALPAPMHAAEKAGVDAFKGISREMHKTVKDMGDQRNGHI